VLKQAELWGAYKAMGNLPANIAKFVETVSFGRCIPPIKPTKSIKPIGCRGTWTQILVNCEWVTVCIEK